MNPKGLQRFESSALRQKAGKMIDTDSGVGRLQSLGPDSDVYEVGYDFSVESALTGNSAVYSPPQTPKRYRISIDEANQKIPNGDYTLQTSSEILRLEKAQGVWRVITN